MRLHITESANAKCFYIIKSIRKDGKNTSQIVEKLGNLDQVRIKAGDQDPYEWAKAYADRLTREEKEQTRTVLIPLNQAVQIPKEEIQRYNGGYLFLQKIYNELKLREICKAIGRRRKYDFDLNAILVVLHHLDAGQRSSCYRSELVPGCPYTEKHESSR